MTVCKRASRCEKNIPDILYGVCVSTKRYRSKKEGGLYGTCK